MLGFIYVGGNPDETKTYGTGYTNKLYVFARNEPTPVTDEDDLEKLRQDTNLKETKVKIK